MITILQQGGFTTVQDEGRWGFQAFGMPIAGAMDKYACRVANLLAGNRENAAVIEMTDCGAAFKFDQEQFVAVCGADMQGKLNGKAVANWSAFFVPKRGELMFDTATSGLRTYLAVRGGIDIPPILGSRSTYTRARIGGLEGRALRQGDVLYLGGDSASQAISRILPSRYIPDYSSELTLRVMLGPQDYMFADSARKSFLTSTYVVAEADRAGYLLKGPKVLPVGKETDIVSDAVGLGAIQIASNGRPFIVTADHQTTRGFAKIGYVIRVDISFLAQARPGDKIRFSMVSEQAAIDALLAEKQIYAKIIKKL
ncbi:biotin-dependent carboxyltransferase family protein [Sporomusa aerivorans]|uniref:5-oxoprolinase subunit C family protein n=1 Tax=Sporomusa aerivorans TaxID=204936 RepID=UPI00352A6DF2